MASTSTTRDMITGAMRLINVYGTSEIPSADDMNISVSALDSMIDSWSNNRLMIYTISPSVFPLTGASSYTLGPGGDWNTTRPMAIEEAYCRLNSNTPQQLDIACQELTDAQYAGISVKNTTSTFPFAIYDNGNYPLRTIYVFPIGAAGNEMVLWLRQPLLDLSNIDLMIDYPPGYERAFRFNLAVELAAEFGKTVPEQVMGVAQASRLELERLNSTPMYLRGDGGMSRSGRNRYFNWITGNYWSFGNN